MIFLMEAWLGKWSVIKNAKTYDELKCSHYFNTLFIISFFFLVPEFTVYTLNMSKVIGHLAHILMMGEVQPLNILIPQVV